MHSKIGINPHLHGIDDIYMIYVITGLFQVSSPVSKLHKLLTESCELVRDLERSVLSSSSAADEEVGMG